LVSRGECVREYMVKNRPASSASRFDKNDKRTAYEDT
jgi:hypothetical protein